MSQYSDIANTIRNNYAYKLIDTCKENNLYIANDRIGENKGIEKKTFKDTPVVDYLILSAELIGSVNEFNVLDLNPLFLL